MGDHAPRTRLSRVAVVAERSRASRVFLLVLRFCSLRKINTIRSIISCDPWSDLGRMAAVSGTFNMHSTRPRSASFAIQSLFASKDD